MKKTINAVRNAESKKFDYEGITRDWVENVSGYAEIATGRKFLSCQRFDLNDKVYFEFWGEHEWEFTFYGPYADLELQKTVLCLGVWMSTQNNKAARLPSLMAYCKERLTTAA